MNPGYVDKLECVRPLDNLTKGMPSTRPPPLRNVSVSIKECSLYQMVLATGTHTIFIHN